mmetsp:Transcript_25586/g.31045  ORF Transcript_25586/g.31045 Transcript_25586/m.31045 type:complete len:243 (-) Transcript_25586:503-1231(-)|eukprot:CAMPEP_0197866104 /NCGR_PEP_ID=MMETSP1438-20131217/44033_1 /TAXON_ID=1461541 /ORGANISM="Pterosperma sp., Strain CCMP1384" /LENGTH=242 /DNA_ID=CAMNT_0043484639 /DNA_START=118 /DNA_END=846 /DNA_ORIENTATION=+
MGKDLVAAAEDREAEARAQFAKYDKNKNGTIERDELTACLEDLGLMKDIPKATYGSFVIEMFGKIDTDSDSHINFKEFSEFYNNAVRENQIKASGHAEKGTPLHAVFITFANYGAKSGSKSEEMEGKNFAKFCKDCKLLHKKKLTTTDVDIIFSKVKAKGARKISFDEFARALTLCAEKLNTSYTDLAAKVVEAGGPATNATTTDKVKLHDDKSAYTGVYSQGGPTNVDGGDLALRGNAQPK